MLYTFPFLILSLSGLGVHEEVGSLFSFSVFWNNQYQIRIICSPSTGTVLHWSLRLSFFFNWLLIYFSENAFTLCFYFY